MKSPCRIVLADNQPASAADFRAALEAEADLALAAAVTCASCSFAAVSQHPTDLLILSLSLPGHRILELVKDLTVLHAGLKLLIITGPQQELEAAHVLRAGAHGCVPASSSMTAKLSAVREILAGNHSFPPPPAPSLQGSVFPLRWLNAAAAVL